MSEFEDLQVLYQMIGNITVVWSLLEMSLDHSALFIFKTCGGKRIKTKIPRPLEQKLHFLQRSFNELPPLAHYKIEATEILKRVSELSGKRHQLIHGAITTTHSVDGAFNFVKIDHLVEPPKLNKVPFTGDDFFVLIKEIEALALDSTKLSRRLVANFVSASN